MTIDMKARAAAEAIWKDLSDRRGIKQELAAVDEDIKQEILDTMAGLIVTALTKPEEA